MFINEPMAKIAINKSIVKEYHNLNDTKDRIVYLDNGTEFQIQLFNPKPYVIGAQISINGEALSGIVAIRPGERIWLERPLVKNNKKFKFETYTVEGGSYEVREAIKNNGEVRIKFFKERKSVSTYMIDDYMPYTYISSKICADNNIENITCSCKGFNTNSNDFLTTSYNSATGIVLSDILPHVETLYSDTLPHDESKYTTNAYYGSVEADKSQEIETGRITSGSKSSQTFNESNIDFENYSFADETIKIYPMSKKPYTSSDLQKVYCTECGRKISPKFKYCPYCGNKC